MNNITNYNHNLKASLNKMVCRLSWDEESDIAKIIMSIYHPTRNYFMFLYSIDNRIDNLLLYTIQNNIRKD